MAVVAPGVQVADRDGLDLGTGKLRDRGRQGLGIERRLDAAVGAHALAHAEPPIARHQRLGRRLAQVVAVVLEPLAHLEDVAVALGRQQPDARALALEQRVGRDRRAVHDALGLARAARRSSTPSASARRSRPSMTPSDWSAGVEGALASVTRPAASTATRSVKVPPTSMPIRYTPQRSGRSSSGAAAPVRLR